MEKFLTRVMYVDTLSTCVAWRSGRRVYAHRVELIAALPSTCAIEYAVDCREATDHSRLAVVRSGGNTNQACQVARQDGSHAHLANPGVPAAAGGLTAWLLAFVGELRLNEVWRAIEPTRRPGFRRPLSRLAETTGPSWRRASVHRPDLTRRPVQAAPTGAGYGRTRSQSRRSTPRRAAQETAEVA